MFRYTVTFLLIFLVVNHDYAVARSFEFTAPQATGIQKRDAFANAQDDLEKDLDSVNEVTQVGNVVKSRQKRRFGSLAKLGKFAKGALGFGATASFALSTGSTIYHAIQQCKDYRPSDCRSVTCHYLKNCPNVCHGPETLRNYVNSERKVLGTKLQNMDNKQRDSFNYATDAILASLNNKKILDEIDSINNKVVRLAHRLAVAMDRNYAELLRNNSVKIKNMLLTEKLALDKVVASPEVDGIFDKWTWEGTGLFVLGIALPLGYSTYTYIKQKLAIRSIYNDLKLNVRQNQKALAKVNPKAAKLLEFRRLSPQIKKQLKQQAKIDYKMSTQQKQITFKEKLANNVLSPALNAVVLALGIWTTFNQINDCQLIANSMQQTAIEMAEQSDKIEKIRVTVVAELYKNVTEKAMPSVRAQMANNQTEHWLEQIRNLTLGAANPNLTIANTIEDFVNNVNTTSFGGFIRLQEKLIGALRSVLYKYTCLANKQNAITTVIVECRAGFKPFPQLYTYATEKHLLNDGDCIKNKEYPYTTQDQFFTILNATAYHQGWYNNCLLNNDALRDRVCDEKVKGYKTPKAIVEQMINTTWEGKLTEDMVPNFLGRCLPPKITPKAIETTCYQYCLYQPIASISKTAVLLEWQVLKVIKTCPICEVTAKDLKTICTQSYCKGINATVIEKEVELPLPTVNSVIANNCSSKCSLETDVKISICNDYKCNGKTVVEIASDKKLIVKAVNDVIHSCNTIIPLCPITKRKRSQTCGYYCLYQPVSRIAKEVYLAESQVTQIIKTCPICYVSKRDLKEICYQHYCQGRTAQTIEKDLEIPLPTVSYMIAHNCSKKCVIEDAATKKAICQDHKCNKMSVAEIATARKLTQQAVNDVLPQCDTIVPVCSVPKATKIRVLNAYCKWGVPQSSIPGLIGVSAAVVQKVIDSHNCADYVKNGLP